MAVIKTDSRHYNDIADAIRAKGISGYFKPSQMSDAIADISTDGVSISDGIIIKSRDEQGYATSVDFYKADGVVNAGTFRVPSGNSIWQKLISISFMNVVTSLQQDCFRGSQITEFSLPDVTEIGGDALRLLPNATSIYLPKLTSISQAQYVFGESLKLQNVQIGSIGYTVTNLRNNEFYADTQSFLTVTVYSNAAYANTILANIRNGAINGTIIIKASEDTVYEGNRYSAGDTLVTSEAST